MFGKRTAGGEAVGGGKISACRKRGLSLYLDEADVGGLLTEALTADVEAVLADQTSGVGADAAVGGMSASVIFEALVPSIVPCCMTALRAHRGLYSAEPCSTLVLLYRINVSS